MCGCGRGKVGERQIKEDLNNRFSEQQFVVDDIKVDLVKHEKNRSLYNITVKMTTPNSTAERMYRILYNYYDVGGWVMDELFEINTGDWKAVPTKFDVSNEKIAEIIFGTTLAEGGCLVRGQASLGSSIANVYYFDWTDGAVSDRKTEEYIDWVDKGEIDNGKISTRVQCSAKSSKWKIIEEFLLCWEFNKGKLQWEFCTAESVRNDIEFYEDIEGKYWTPGINGNKESMTVKNIDGELKIEDNTSVGWIVGGDRKGRIEITGLFKGKIYDGNGNWDYSITFLVNKDGKLKMRISDTWTTKIFEKE